MTKAKIFFGNSNYTPADITLNEWLSQHPNIKIVHTHYQQARYGDHSIYILYEED